ncbi:unnamed protein product [Somion occarium]|uniref:Glycosyltransferase family 1 protein n=1 Tax=Somion occarium TaxID=3059160 RepID=A0ABP1DSA4_9APHY
MEVLATLRIAVSVSYAASVGRAYPIDAEVPNRLVSCRNLNANSVSDTCIRPPDLQDVENHLPEYFHDSITSALQLSLSSKPQALTTMGNVFGVIRSTVGRRWTYKDSKAAAMPAADSMPHLVLVSHEGVGHTRPFAAFAARFVQTKPAHITFFTTIGFYDRVVTDVARNLGEDEATLGPLIRIVALEPEEPIICARTGKELPPIASPDAAVVDCIGYPSLQVVRELSVKPVKVFSWMPSQQSSLVYPLAPVRYGGREDVRPKIREEAARTGRKIEEVLEEMILVTKDEVTRVPGLPPMYDYELHPQQLLFGGLMGALMMLMQNVVENCDGLIMATPEPYEPEGIDVIRRWFTETSRDIYPIGPMVPFGKKAMEGENKQSQDAGDIEQFLESILKSHGPKSVIYFAFGSVCWPAEPEKLWAFLDVVMEHKIPFILSHVSPFANIPDAVKEKVAGYGLGRLTPWAPQQAVLAHDATGWFVTHGGHNSTIEAICYSVPMIFWPYTADEPTNAARLTDVLDASYELLEVRSGEHGLKPLYRTGKAPTGTMEAVREEAAAVLRKAFGEDGKRKRANLEQLSHKVVHTWDEGGSARREMQRLADSLKVVKSNQAP